MAADAASEAPFQVLMISMLPSASSTLKPVQDCSAGTALALSHSALPALPFAEVQLAHPPHQPTAALLGKEML